MHRHQPHGGAWKLSHKADRAPRLVEDAVKFTFFSASLAMRGAGLEIGSLMPPRLIAIMMIVLGMQVARSALVKPPHALRQIVGEEKVRTSELYQRYVEKIAVIAKAQKSSPDWKATVDSTVRQFHTETMSMARPPFCKARDDMGAELEVRANMNPEGRARDVFSRAADLIEKL